MSSWSTEPHAETLYNTLGDFGKDTPLAMVIIAVSSLALWGFARLVGIRGPWPWLGIYGFAVIVGKIGMDHNKALSSYILLLGLAGCYGCLWAGLRQFVPEEVAA